MVRARLLGRLGRGLVRAVGVGKGEGQARHGGMCTARVFVRGHRWSLVIDERVYQ